MEPVRLAAVEELSEDDWSGGSQGVRGRVILVRGHVILVRSRGVVVRGRVILVRGRVILFRSHVILVRGHVILVHSHGVVVRGRVVVVRGRVVLIGVEVGNKPRGTHPHQPPVVLHRGRILRRLHVNGARVLQLRGFIPGLSHSSRGVRVRWRKELVLVGAELPQRGHLRTSSHCILWRLELVAVCNEQQALLRSHRDDAAEAQHDPRRWVQIAQRPERIGQPEAVPVTAPARTSSHAADVEIQAEAGRDLPAVELLVYDKDHSQARLRFTQPARGCEAIGNVY